MKKGIEIEKKGNKIYISGDYSDQFRVKEYTNRGYDIGNSYLSWENASYMYSEPDEEEADDYLLNHALQENKKLCVCICTSDPESIKKHFECYNEFEIYVQKTLHYKNDNVFVYRKGSLSDYFDMEYIEDLFCENGIQASSLPAYENKPIADFVTGKCRIDGVPYNLIMDTENLSTDKILATYGPVALIISGLIFGYPIEIIETAIKIIFPYGESN